MTGLQWLGVFLLVYGIFSLILGIFKVPKKIWNMGKIQAFRTMLKDGGTQIFIAVWGAIALGFGIWLTFLRG